MKELDLDRYDIVILAWFIMVYACFTYLSFTPLDPPLYMLFILSLLEVAVFLGKHYFYDKKKKD